MTDKKRLGDLLIDSDLITEDELEKALRLQVGGNRRLGYLLIKMGFISEEQLHAVLSKQLDLPIVKVEEEFDPSVKKFLPKYLCNKYSVIPLSTGANNTLKVAMVDPSDSEAVADIEKYTQRLIRPVLASKSDISANISSRIPWTLRDIFNSQTSTKLTAGIAGIALILIILTATQFYQDRQQDQFGNVIHIKTPRETRYENLELILGFNDNGITLLGHGAYSSGFYSVTFDNAQGLEKFIASKKDDFSDRQYKWLQWAMSNPRGNK